MYVKNIPNKKTITCGTLVGKYIKPEAVQIHIGNILNQSINCIW